MLNTILIPLDVAFLAYGGYLLYRHSQIDIHAGYATFQVFFAAVLAMWFVTAGISNLPYIILMATFITLVVLSGASGLTPTRVIATGVFSRVIPYTKLAGITLTPLSLPNGRQLVIAIFNLKPRRFVRLTFRSDLESLIQTIRPRLPEDVAITIQHVQ
ncbi:hypothetical protein ACFQ5J_01490 [Lacticaseibacillus baoqingensis]|uniref:Uncharacterized protein n=1 Tax=Lacticaseibacillus baoqingensis TaxID=2486013 RepID=A0ABW4E1W1_9LACO|nr:hypothetical protein [Lacticaseibacillus baoqingensis]